MTYRVGSLADYIDTTDWSCPHLYVNRGRHGKYRCIKGRYHHGNHFHSEVDWDDMGPQRTTPDDYHLVRATETTPDRTILTGDIVFVEVNGRKMSSFKSIRFVNSLTIRVGR